MSAEAYVWAAGLIAAAGPLYAVASVGAWWLREGKASRSLDVREAAVESEIAEAPRPSTVLPPDQVEPFPGERYWPIEDDDTLELPKVERERPAIEAGRWL